MRNSFSLATQMMKAEPKMSAVQRFAEHTTRHPLFGTLEETQRRQITAFPVPNDGKERSCWSKGKLQRLKHERT